MANWICDADLANIMGKYNARTLTTVLGGQRVYVPAAAHASHKIALAVGVDAMDRLCRARAGETLALPNGRQKDTAKRQAERLLGQGKSLSYIADACNITIRYAERIAQDMREQALRPKQCSLL